jgi:murein DD-endopeptidase MepM/ murein hydrolase activator NlpD
VRPRLVVSLLLAAVLLASAAAAGGAGTSASASASAWAARVQIAGKTVASTPVATPASSPVAGERFSYPADGSAVSLATSLATASTTIAANAGAVAEADASNVSLFGGVITADSVTARASAGTGVTGAGGNQNGSALAGVAIDGKPFAGTHATLGAWGVLTVGTTSVDRTAVPGTRAYAGSIVELDVRLVAAYAGLPAGAEIEIGEAQAAAETAPAARASTPPTNAQVGGPPLGDRPQDWPPGMGSTALPPYAATPTLAAGPYVFPVYGSVAYRDTFGYGDDPHGIDLLGQLGQPVVACVGGTIFSVGWDKAGGNRLWLRDQRGDVFYYANLSAFSTLATDGSHVRAGQVIGFMGDTGEAAGSAPQLRFEVHPVEYLYLGGDGSVDPTPYLRTWPHEQTLPFPVEASSTAALPGAGTVPEPGAILLGQHDISAANGLDPASLVRALRG